MQRKKFKMKKWSTVNNIKKFSFLFLVSTLLWFVYERQSNSPRNDNDEIPSHHSEIVHDHKEDDGLCELHDVVLSSQNTFGNTRTPNLFNRNFMMEH
jgi:hypothetical protein